MQAETSSPKGGGVGRYVAKRLLFGAATVWLVLTGVFFAFRLMPGDPAEIWLGDYATPQLVRTVSEKWGLDKPLLVQYAIFARRLFQGDLGDSFRTPRPVLELLAHHYPYTLRLLVPSFVLSVIFGTALGVIAATKQNSLIDLAVISFSVLLISVPEFWLAIILIIALSLHAGIFPVIGAEKGWVISTYPYYLTLPVLTLAMWGAAMVSRLVRSSVIEVLGKAYIQVAMSKGLAWRRVVWKHALRAALAPIISLMGVNLTLLMGGSVVLEMVFSRPGIGYLYVQSASARDYPMLQGCVLAISIGVVAVNLLVDVCYGFVDPRIRYD